MLFINVCGMISKIKDFRFYKKVRQKENYAMCIIYDHLCKKKEKRGVWVCMCLNVYVLICVSIKLII